MTNCTNCPKRPRIEVIDGLVYHMGTCPFSDPAQAPTWLIKRCQRYGPNGYRIKEGK